MKERERGNSSFSYSKMSAEEFSGHVLKRVSIDKVETSSLINMCSVKCWRQCSAFYTLRHACWSMGLIWLLRGVGFFCFFFNRLSRCSYASLTALLHEKEPLCHTNCVKYSTFHSEGLLSMLSHFTVRKVSPLIELFVQAVITTHISVILSFYLYHWIWKVCIIIQAQFGCWWINRSCPLSFTPLYSV